MGALRFIWRWLQICGAVVVIVALAWLLAGMCFHVKLLNVQTGSMRPTFSPGDALIMERLSTGQLRPGIIVSYHSARNPNELVTHRVIKVTGESFQTKGDHLSRPDPVVRTSLVAGKVVVVLPGMGRVLGWVKSWPGLITFVYLPVVAVTVQELIRFEQRFVLSRTYRLRPEVV